jgi:hypothetical protein
VPQPPAEFAALKVGRLNEALFVSFNAMSGANLRAVNRVVKVVRELDRYHLLPEREAPALVDNDPAASIQAPPAHEARVAPAGNVAAND